jgi:signal transduction histidine kinase
VTVLKRNPGAIPPVRAVDGDPENEHWRGAWVLLSGALVALLALNAFTLWIEFGGSVDPGAVVAAEPGLRTGFRYFGFEFIGDSLGFGALLTVSALALSRNRSNRFAWLLGGAVTGWMLANLLMGFVVIATAGVLPTSWSPALAWLANAAYMGFPLGLSIAFAVFPSGRLSLTGISKRILQSALAIPVVLGLVILLHPAGLSLFGDPTPPSFENPLALDALAIIDVGIAGIALVMAGLASLASLVRTYLSSGTEVRHQLKWIVAVVPIMLATSALMELVDTPWEGFPAMVSLWLFALALGVAVTKYRLYEIDLIINRALVFGTLAAFIGFVYVTVVVGIGSVVGGSSLGWSITATALVAVVFEPIRNRLQRWVNRLVYGMRATPYEVLSDLTGRLAAAESEERLLHRMAERLGEGTGAERASVWLTDDAGFRLAAASPTASGLMERAGSLDEISASAFAVEHEGEVLGALSVEKARGDVLTPTERRLIEDLAGSAGLVMRRLRLDEALERKAAELEESRRRLLDAQDVERRRLERELHDGPQQQVVGLKVKLGLVQQLAEQEGTEQVAALAGQMASEAQDAIEQIRSLAQGIYPPLLQSDGLKAAVPALASSSPMDVNVGVELERRWPLPIEAAVYFCISEALTNAAKHGNGPITVSVSDTDTELAFEVSDRGPGFDPATTKRGAGLNNMSDRLDGLGGSVVIASTPGGSTRVIGSVPFRVLADV